MRFKVCFLILAFMATIFGQEVKSSVEFYDTIANKKTGEIGWIGNAENGSFFIDANGQKRLVIKNDTTTVTGHIKATSYIGDGSKLTGIISDSARAASVADSSRKIPDGSVTNAKLAASIKIKDENIDSVSWSKLKGVPAGFADGVDNTAGSLGDSVRAATIADSCKKIPDGSVTSEKFATSLKIKADSSRAAFIADSCKKIPDGSITNIKFASTVKIKDENIDSVSWSKIKNKPSGIDSVSLTGADYFTYVEDDGYEISSFAGSTANIASITISAPAAGCIIINASASIYFVNLATSYVSSGGIFTTPNKLGPLDKGPAISVIGDYGKMYPWSLSRGFQVSGKGEYTYYLVFKNTTNADIKILSQMLTGIFCPKKL